MQTGKHPQVPIYMGYPHDQKRIGEAELIQANPDGSARLVLHFGIVKIRGVLMGSPWNMFVPDESTEDGKEENKSNGQ